MDRRDAPSKYARQQIIRACAAEKSGCLDAGRKDGKRGDVYRLDRPNLRATPVTDHVDQSASAAVARVADAAPAQIPDRFAAIRRYQSHWKKDRTPAGYPWSHRR